MMLETKIAPLKRKATAPPRRVSLAAYFEAEEKALHKSEFNNGIITPMAGAKLNHNRLATQAALLMGVFIFENDFGYIVSNSDTKIRIEDFNKVVYPDAVVICEKPEFFEGREDTITNPLLIVEVLSFSSKKHDRETKFEYYRTLPSFREYVLINQERKRVSVATKQPDATWILRDYDGEESTAVLYALHNCPLPLNRLYRNIEL